jgi:hypothetical protein
MIRPKPGHGSRLPRSGTNTIANVTSKPNVGTNVPVDIRNLSWTTYDSLVWKRMSHLELLLSFSSALESVSGNSMIPSISLTSNLKFGRALPCMRTTSWQGLLPVWLQAAQLLPVPMGLQGPWV